MEGILSQQELKETLLTCAATDAGAAVAVVVVCAFVFTKPSASHGFLQCPAWLNLNSMIYDLQLHLISTKNRNGNLILKNK